MYAAQAPVVEYISLAPAVSYAAPLPIDEYISPATAVYAALAHVVEYTTTAPDVTGEMWKNKSPFEDRIFQ